MSLQGAAGGRSISERQTIVISVTEASPGYPEYTLTAILIWKIYLSCTHEALSKQTASYVKSHCCLDLNIAAFIGACERSGCSFPACDVNVHKPVFLWRASRFITLTVTFQSDPIQHDFVCLWIIVPFRVKVTVTRGELQGMETLWLLRRGRGGTARMEVLHILNPNLSNDTWSVAWWDPTNVTSAHSNTVITCWGRVALYAGIFFLSFFFFICIYLFILTATTRTQTADVDSPAPLTLSCQTQSSTNPKKKKKTPMAAASKPKHTNHGGPRPRCPPSLWQWRRHPPLAVIYWVAETCTEFCTLTPRQVTTEHLRGDKVKICAQPIGPRSTAQSVNKSVFE